METTLKNTAYFNGNAPFLSQQHSNSFELNTETKQLKEAAIAYDKNDNRQASLETPTLLFRKQEGDSWIVIVREASGVVQGQVNEEGGNFRPIALKGIPSSLAPKDIPQAQSVLTQSRLKLTEYQIEILPGLKGGMMQEKEDSKQEEKFLVTSINNLELENVIILEDDKKILCEGSFGKGAELHLSTIPSSLENFENNLSRKGLEQLELDLTNFDSLNDQNKYTAIKNIAEVIGGIEFQSSHPSITVFLGTTGSGKSTLVNYLAGADITVKWNDKEQNYFPDVVEVSNNLKIGHGFKSCTRAPVSFVDTDNDLVYFDCPGYDDTRGMVHELMNACYIQAVLRTAVEIKFVLTVTEGTLNRVHIKDLKEAIDALESYAKEFKAIASGVLLVITKGKTIRRRDDESFIREQLEEILKDGGLTHYQEQFIKFIKDNNRFQFSFKAPTEQLEDLPVSSQERSKIIKELKVLQPTPQKLTANLKVSYGVKIAIAKFTNYLNIYIQEHIQIFGKNLEQYYIQEVQSLEDSFKDIVEFQANLDLLQKSLEAIYKKSFKNTLDLYQQLESALNFHHIDIGISSLSAIKNLENTLALFRQINPELPIYDQNAWKLSLRIISEKLLDLSRKCETLKDQYPIKPGAPYMQKRDEKIAKIYLHSIERLSLSSDEEIFKNAENQYKEALKYTDLPEHYAAYATLLAEAGKNEKACKAFYELGELYKKNEEFDKAAIAYSQALECLPEKEILFKALVEIYTILHKPTEAAQYIKKIAALYERKNQLGEACKYYKEAFEVCKKPNLLFKLAKLHKQQEKIEEYLYYKHLFFEEALKMNSKNIMLRVKYRNFLKNQNRKIEAVAEKKKICELIRETEKRAKLYELMLEGVVALDFAKKPNIDTKECQEIVNNSVKLKTLDLRGCSQLADTSTYKFLKEKSLELFLPSNTEPCLGLKRLHSKDAFTERSVYFIKESGFTYNTNKRIGRYIFLENKKKGIEPGFIGRKGLTNLDVEKMIVNSKHKYYTQAEQFIRNSIFEKEAKNIIYQEAKKLLKATERPFTQLTFNEQNAIVKHIKEDPSTQPIVNEYLEQIETNKFSKKHFIKLDYKEVDRRLNIVHSELKGITDVKGILRYYWNGKNQREANLNAVRECLANDLTRSLGVVTQKLQLIPSQYKDLYPKLLLDGTEMQGDNGEKFIDFNKKLAAGYLIHDEDQQYLHYDPQEGKNVGSTKQSTLSTDDTIKDLGRFKIIMLLLADKDAVGPRGDNKGYIEIIGQNPEVSYERKQKIFAAIDPGHSLNAVNSSWFTNLMKYYNINSDFSFQQPTNYADQVFPDGYYRNFTIFDDTPFLEKMEGVVQIKKVKDLKEDEAIFDEYITRFDGRLHKFLNFKIELTEIKNLYIRRRDYILNEVFNTRLPLMENDDGKLALNILDCLEKHTSETSLHAASTKLIKLKYPRVIKRAEWCVEERADSFIFETNTSTKINFKAISSIIGNINGVILFLPNVSLNEVDYNISSLAESSVIETDDIIYFEPEKFEVSEPKFNNEKLNLRIECSRKSLEILNQKLDVWGQFNK